MFNKACPSYKLSDTWANTVMNIAQGKYSEQSCNGKIN